MSPLVQLLLIVGALALGVVWVLWPPSYTLIRWRAWRACVEIWKAWERPVPPSWQARDPEPEFGVFAKITSTLARKVSRDTPNIANTRAWLELGEQFPELVDRDVWITGSRVWRVMLGEPIPEGADLDVFATTTEAYDRVCNALRKRGGILTERPAENRSHARGVGMRVEPPPLVDGATGIAFDVWYETGDVFAQLAIFPTDGYAHCRAAYNIARRSFVVLANENAK